MWLVALTVGLATAETVFARAEQGPAAPVSQTVRERAEALARDANKAFDRFMEEGADPRGGAAARDRYSEAKPVRAQRSIESGSDWLVRVDRSYGALIERLSEATVPNPVVDAATRQAAEREALWAKRRDAKPQTELPRPAHRKPAKPRLK